MSTEPQQNLIEMLLANTETKKSAVAARSKSDGLWKNMSWGELTEQVRKISNGLVAWGIKPGDRVAVYASTSLQWVIADLAIMAAQAICIPVYSSNTAEEARYVIQNSGATLLFVDNDVAEAKQPGRLTRTRSKLAQLAEVKQIVLFEGAPEGEREITLSSLIDQGLKNAAGNTEFDARAKAIKTDDLSHFLYTSGTTGDPKGVMLTHGNWAFEALALRNLDVLVKDESVMLFLPLAHSFAQLCKAGWLAVGCTLVLAESVDKVVANLAETSPTLLPAVPRVFEKVFAGVQANAVSAKGIKGKLGRWAFSLFDEYAEAKAAGRSYDTLGWKLAKKLVFSKVRVALDVKLGGRMRLFASGGAPLSKKIAYFFDLLGYIVSEGYGLTETSAASSINPPRALRLGTVGKPLPGTEAKIASDGEILLRGPHIMKGYYKNEAATAEVLEADGWFHSGDIGELDADGYLRITDRKKDIIVTAGGKNVAPQNLENTLKTYPVISQSMVYGDKRPYLTVLVCVNEEGGKKLLSDQGVTVSSYADLVKHPAIRQAVQDVIDSVNKDQPPYNSLKKFTLLDHDFSQEGGEMTPTLKVKRKFCTQKYWPLLEAMYDEKVL